MRKFVPRHLLPLGPKHKYPTVEVPGTKYAETELPERNRMDKHVRGEVDARSTIRGFASLLSKDKAKEKVREILDKIDDVEAFFNDTFALLVDPLNAFLRVEDEYVAALETSIADDSFWDAKVIKPNKGTKQDALFQNTSLKGRLRNGFLVLFESHKAPKIDAVRLLDKARRADGTINIEVLSTHVLSWIKGIGYNPLRLEEVELKDVCIGSLDNSLGFTEEDSIKGEEIKSAIKRFLYGDTIGKEEVGEMVVFLRKFSSTVRNPRVFQTHYDLLTSKTDGNYIFHAEMESARIHALSTHTCPILEQPHDLHRAIEHTIYILEHGNSSNAGDVQVQQVLQYISVMISAQKESSVLKEHINAIYERSMNSRMKSPVQRTADEFDLIDARAVARKILNINPLMSSPALKEKWGILATGALVYNHTLEYIEERILNEDWV